MAEEIEDRLLDEEYDVDTVNKFRKGLLEDNASSSTSKVQPLLLVSIATIKECKDKAVARISANGDKEKCAGIQFENV